MLAAGVCTRFDLMKNIVHSPLFARTEFAKNIRGTRVEVPVHNVKILIQREREGERARCFGIRQTHAHTKIYISSKCVYACKVFERASAFNVSGLIFQLNAGYEFRSQ